MELFDSKKIGLELKRLRMEHHYTQEQIADGLNCTVAFVSNLENNRAKLNLRTLIYYAKLCNVTIDSILQSSEPGEDTLTNRLDAELLHLFHQFSSDEQEKIIKVLQCIKTN